MNTSLYAVDVPTRLLSVNMRHMDRWRVTSDNVRFYDCIMRNKGTFLTLDYRPYVDLLCQFNIFYTIGCAHG